MKDKYIKDLEQIKDIMDRSTRFISLSGLAGISTGITALAGVYLAYQALFKDSNYLVYNAVELSGSVQRTLLSIAIGTLLLSVMNALFFTRRKTKKRHKSAWNRQTKRLLLSLLIPLVAGGLFSLMLLFKGFVGILPSVTLLFYGLALVNASNYSLPEIKKLGLIEIFLGLLAFQFIGFSLHFWAFGFGIIQILYGLIIQRKDTL